MKAGCARFGEISSELIKTWSSGDTEFWVWIGNYNVKVWKSTEEKLHKIWRSVHPSCYALLKNITYPYMRVVNILTFSETEI